MKVALTGFMGAGKTTVGKKLAELFHVPFIEIDLLIPKFDEPHHRSISEIFSQSGEAVFRQIETVVWKDVLADGDACIATGGGLIIQEQNYNAVEGRDLCLVYLSAKLETIEARLAADTLNTRPLADPAQLERLYLFRKPLYEERCHLMIEVDGKSVDEVVEEAYKRVKEFYASPRILPIPSSQ